MCVCVYSVNNNMTYTLFGLSSEALEVEEKLLIGMIEQ